MAADNACRARARECLSLAECMNDPEERAGIVRFARMWMSLSAPVDEGRGSYEFPRRSSRPINRGQVETNGQSLIGAGLGPHLTTPLCKNVAVHHSKNCALMSNRARSESSISNHASKGSPTYCSANDACACSEACKIVELVQPHLLFERGLAGKSVQQHRQPPGHARCAPHATQCHVGVAIEVVCLTGTGLAQSDPGNGRWQRDLAVSYGKVGNVQVVQGDLPAALSSYQAVLGLMERLAQSDPGNATGSATCRFRT